jgi:hypothetical protein
MTTRRQVATLALLIATASLLVAVASRAQAPPRARNGFEYLVRADFFAGFAGDAARLQRGMKVCEDALAANPEHADALVWHGAGLMILAGEAFSRQDVETGRDRARRGREEMDRAERLAPDSLSVMLVRAAVLSASASRASDRAASQAMQRSAVDGFERALAIQAPYLSTLSEHARGELLAGLAEGWSRLGDDERARGYLQRIVQELPDTRYQARAQAWLEDGPSAGPLTCLTCHRP